MPRTKLADTEKIEAQVAKAKSPTDTFVEYAAWLKENAGVNVSATNAQIVSRLYGEFQAQNRENGSPRSRTAAGTVAPKPAKPVAKAKVGEAVTDPGAKTKPAPGRRGAAAKPAASKDVKAGTAKPSTPRSGRRGKVESVEAPY
jgi:hypothetical protein